MGSFSDLQFLGQISGLLPGKPVQLLAKNMGNLALAGEWDIYNLFLSCDFHPLWYEDFSWLLLYPVWWIHSRSTDELCETVSSHHPNGSSSTTCPRWVPISTNANGALTPAQRAATQRCQFGGPKNGSCEGRDGTQHLEKPQKNKEKPRKIPRKKQTKQIVKEKGQLGKKLPWFFFVDWVF